MKTLQLAREKRDSEQSHLGSAMGTPGYMSPEQAVGRWDILDHRSDIYSLGGILYVILTGQPSLKRGNLGEIIQKVQQGDFPPPLALNRSAPQALQAICLKAMALKPEDRFDTALELSAELERWLADEPVHAYSEPLLQKLWRWIRLHQVLVTSTAVLILTTLLGLAVGLIVVEQQKQEKETQRQIAVNAKLKAQRSEQQAQRQSQLALDTIREVVWGFQRDLQASSMTRKMRENMLSKALERVKQLGRKLVNSVEANHTTMVAHAEIGDILYQTGGSQTVEGSRGSAETMLGWTREAQRHYHQAFNVAQKLIQQTPFSAAAQRNLWVSHNNLGKVSLTLGDTQSALEHYRQAMDICKKLFERESSSVRARRDFSVSHNNLGEVNLMLGDTRIRK